MKRLFSLLILPCLLIASSAALAAKRDTKLTQNQLDAAIRRINAQTQSLESEVKMLRTEVKYLKSQVKSKSVSPAKAKRKTGTRSVESKSAEKPIELPKPQTSYDFHHRIYKGPQTPREGAQETMAQSAKEEAKAMVGHEEYQLSPGAKRAIRFQHPITVTTSPFLGIQTAFNASDLVAQYSSMNEDLILLRHRQQLQHALLAEGSTLANRGVIEISGGLEGQALYANGYGGAEGNVNLSTAELDINAIASNWANGFFSIDFDDSPAITGTRVPNSRLYLERGFLTIGNLDVSPVYFTIGQMYVPFGRYAGGSLITTPLIESLARTLVRAVLLGYVQGPFYSQIYAYTGNMTTGGSGIIKQGGINLGAAGDFAHGSYDVGAGYITTISDSQGMQNNRLPEMTPSVFRGFGEPAVPGGPNFNNLRHRVPAADGHAEITLGPVQFIGEYINVLRNFSPLDLTFNNMPAHPSAFHVQINYMFTYWDRPFSVGITYGQTAQALALNLPRRSLSGVFAVSIWKDTIETLEFRHDWDYTATDFANGGTPRPGPGSFFIINVPIRGTGNQRNMILGQIGVYF